MKITHASKLHATIKPACLTNTFWVSRTPPNVEYLPYLPKHSTTKTLNKDTHYVLKISWAAKFSPQIFRKRYSSYWADEEILLGATYSHVRKQQTCHHRTAQLLLLSGDVNLQTLVIIPMQTLKITIQFALLEKPELKNVSQSQIKLCHKYPNTQYMVYFLACTIEIRPFLGIHTIPLSVWDRDDDLTIQSDPPSGRTCAS